MVIIESEWDFGYGDKVFESKERAIELLKNDPNVQELCKDLNHTVESLVADGLVSFKQVLMG